MSIIRMNKQGVMPRLNKKEIANASLGKVCEFELGTSRYEEKSRRLCLEYLRVGHLPQSTRAYK
ncbi:hypothetical protein Goari_006419 [Gossypium aridum]|uniref:Uncharacterized protein n=1 Tax=Gossypium aridum TaxID=34290 RepID=A0A7J8XMU3_GOSAI|nr:hypothetical protein [Gossypium aridum]